MRGAAVAADPRWDAASDVLCVRLDSIGDVLMTTPALRALKEAKPGRRITLLTSPAGAQIAALVPHVDDVIAYDAPWMKATRRRINSEPDRAMVETLRAARFDASVIFTVYSQNPLPAALLCYFADIPLRLAHCRENPYQLLTHWIRDPEPEACLRHEVQRQLDLVAEIGGALPQPLLSLSVPDDASARVERLLSQRGLRTGRFIPIHPGASAPSRRYPADAFAEVARLLSVETGLPVVFTGSAEEHELIEDIRAMSAAPADSLAGCLDLAELAALLTCAPVLISNNSAPVHLAAAVGTPVVDLYALTNPQHTPWGVPSRVLFHDVPCKFCYSSVCPEGHHRCLRLVSPQRVVQSTLELLQAAPGEVAPSPSASPTVAPGWAGN